MEIEIQSLSINVPWWFLLITLGIFGRKIKPKALWKLFKDWVKSG
jgi:hypothetical protein